MKPYGLAAEFSTHEQLIRAAEEAYARGFRQMDGYAPFPLKDWLRRSAKKTGFRCWS